MVTQNGQIASLTDIQTRIYLVRGVQVMLDIDLAVLYGVENRSLRQAVRRNIQKFPEDFLLKLTESESNELISRGGVTKCDTPGIQHWWYADVCIYRAGCFNVGNCSP